MNWEAIRSLVSHQNDGHNPEFITLMYNGEFLVIVIISDQRIVSNFMILRRLMYTIAGKAFFIRMKRKEGEQNTEF